MELVSVRAAIWDVVHTIRCLSVEQILRYFREADSEDILLKYIFGHVNAKVFECHGFAENYQKMADGTIDLDELIERVKQSNVTLHKAHWVQSGIAAISKRFDAQTILTAAFWPIAEIGCDRIKEIIPIITPQKSATLMFSTMDRQQYDLTWCFLPADITKAVAEWNACPYEQPTNHVALVKTRELGQAALTAGFDSYCILDAEHHPQYFIE